MPEIIGGANSDGELSARIVNVLLTGLDRAQAAALVVAKGTSDKDPVEVLNWDRRSIDLSDFSPSDRLIRQAIATGESVVHVWNSQPEAAFTSSVNVGLGLCHAGARRGVPRLGNLCRRALAWR